MYFCASINQFVMYVVIRYTLVHKIYTLKRTDQSIKLVGTIKNPIFKGCD